LALALMVGGLAVLYPRYLHPMLLTVMGRSDVSFGGGVGGAISDNSANIHPRQLRDPPLPGGRRPLAGRHGAGAKFADSPDTNDVDHEVNDKGEGGGRRGGLAAVALPVYAVGILLYLAYTLFKAIASGGAGAVLAPKRSSSGSTASSAEAMREQALRDYYRNFRYDPVSGQFINGPQSTDDYFGGGLARNAMPEADQEARYQRMRVDLQRLLHRLDDQDASEADLLRLKARLEDTERQMAGVLAAMRPRQEGDGAPDGADVDDDDRNDEADEEEPEAEGQSTAPADWDGAGPRRRRLRVD
ncbi:hypothetical protein BOX15_Mlig015733g2, partial [Macrostomum lignano]